MLWRCRARAGSSVPRSVWPWPTSTTSSKTETLGLFAVALGSVTARFYLQSGSILESTIWMETPPIKVVWITMLAMADRDGIVEASIPGLAKRAAVDRTLCEQALAVFLSPDPDSRTQEYEGRRIEVVEGGWRLLNYEVYRQRASAEEAREKAAARKRRQRQRQASHAMSQESVTGVTVTECPPIAPAPVAPPAPAEAREKQKIKAAPTAQSASVSEAEKNVRILTKIAHEVLARDGNRDSEADRIENIKLLCAARKIAYDSMSVRKALDSAEFQRQ